MRLGNRERIVIGVIAALAAIAALHMFIFRGRAAEYRAAKADYDTLTSQLTTVGSPNRFEAIYGFQYQTINNELAFWRLLQEMDLTVPQDFVGKPDAWAQKERVRTFLHQLQAMRAKDGAELARIAGVEQASLGFDVANLPTLTFLELRPFAQNPRDAYRGVRWGLATELPPQFRQADVGDAIAQLHSKLQVINVIPEGSELHSRQQAEYNRGLAALGLDLRVRDFVTQQFGEPAGLLHTLSRVEVVKEQLNPNVLRTNEDREYDDRVFVERLEDLFQVEWPKAVLLAHNQLLGLIDLVELAATHDVDEITMVKLWENVNIRYPPKSNKKEAEPETPALDPMAALQGAPVDFEAMMMGGGGMDPAAMGGFGKGGFAGGAAPVPTDDREIVAASVPIEMTFNGSNVAVMNYLYGITSAKRFYELTSLSLRAIPGQENKIEAHVVINVISHYSGFVKAPEDIEKQIEEILTRKREIASRPGARELAVQEGFDPGPATPAQ